MLTRTAMKKALGSVIVCMLVLSMVSCSNVGRENRSRMMLLKLGMDREQVLSVMGMPYKNEACRTRGGQAVETLFYGTGSTPVFPHASLTPLVFENGRLAGWGKEVYEARVTSKDAQPTYTLGRHDATRHN